MIYNLIGKEFERLLVLRRSLKNNTSTSIYWKCKCSCGNFIVVRSDHLRNKKIKSCGCLQKENLSKISGHNKYHNFVGTKFYNVWSNLKNRCNNKNNIHFKWYGKRGITYDLKWNNFLNFKEDMYFKYIYAKRLYGEKCLSIERVDVNGNYCFDNCIFIPINEQYKNRRKRNYNAPS